MTTVTSRIARAFVLGAALAASLGSFAVGQSPTQSSGPAAPRNTVGTLTVTAKRRTDEATIKTVIAPFVNLHAARDRKTGLLVRAPPSGVCPTTLGLSPAFDDFVTARIVEVAKAVDAPVAKARNCQPNIEVVFTEDPQDLVDRLAKRSGGGFLGFRHLAEERALSRATRPIQAWYMTGTVSDVHPEATRLVEASGSLQSNRPSDELPSAAGVADNAYWPDPFFGTGSRFAPRHSSQLMNVLIVADLGKLDGREIGPISDYVAMLALSQVKALDACNALPSILDMLAASCQGRPAPQALTDSDFAFLKALYASDLTASGDGARYRVEHRMAKDIGPVKP